MSFLKNWISEKKDWLRLLLVVLIWGLYAQHAPGGEFFGVYQQIVFDPAAYQSNPAIFNPPWIFPLLAPWITMPGRAGFIIYLFIIIASSFFATKILKGNFLLVLLSAQLFWVLWWGQIDWIVLLGIGMAWYAYQKESWWLMGIAILLVIIKPQLGVFAMMYLWFVSKGRWKSAAFVFAFFILSLLVWGLWPVWIVEHAIKMAADPAHQLWNASLGLKAFPILLIVLIIKKSPPAKFLALIAATMLVSPYLPYYSSVALLCFPLPLWMGVFAFLGYLPGVIGPALAWQSLFLFPLCVLGWVYWPEMIWVWQRIRLGASVFTREPF